MRQRPTEVYLLRSRGSRSRFQPRSATNVGKNRHGTCEGYQKAKAPMLGVMHDRAKTLRGLRAVEVDKSIEQDFLSEEY